MRLHSHDRRTGSRTPFIEQPGSSRAATNVPIAAISAPLAGVPRYQEAHVALHRSRFYDRPPGNSPLKLVNRHGSRELAGPMESRHVRI